MSASKNLRGLPNALLQEVRIAALAMTDLDHHGGTAAEGPMINVRLIEKRARFVE
jgi:hypothetical protein